ncbi:MAG: putative hydro-lyase [Synergistaceae bacterium]|nr:putative hydro-lyase [Synergistaceae bacterium]
MLDFNTEPFRNTSPREMRNLIRAGEWTYPTTGLCNGNVQCNLIVLPKDWAYDFLVFAQRNPKSCPLLDVTEIGSPKPVIMAEDSDLRTDIPKYRVWRDGVVVDEPTDVIKYWRDDLVAFLTGCSFSFENALVENSIPMRHIDDGTNVAVYITNIQCTPAGRLSGPMVVSMRPVRNEKVPASVLCTGRFPSMHGAPVHIGDPSAIGIKDINKVDFGDRIEVKEGEMPVFWACGVTPQAVVMNSKPPFAITHAPGYMYISDRTDTEYSVM